MAAGALVLFRGRYALHRVTPVEGARPRLLAALSYDPEPGRTLYRTHPEDLLRPSRLNRPA
jgi:hypothetical protein